MIDSLINNVAHFATHEDDPGRKSFLNKMQVAKIVAVSVAILSAASFVALGGFFGFLLGGVLLTVAHDVYKVANNAQNIADYKFDYMNDPKVVNAHLFRNTIFARFVAGPFIEDKLATALR